VKKYGFLFLLDFEILDTGSDTETSLTNYLGMPYKLSSFAFLFFFSTMH
jgi:hypothetical protein